MKPPRAVQQAPPHELFGHARALDDGPPYEGGLQGALFRQRAWPDRHNRHFPDVFAIIAGDFDKKTFDIGSGSYVVHKVNFTAADDAGPTATLIKKVHESGFLIVPAALNNDTIFVAEAGKGDLYTMSLSTGEYSVVLLDPKMKDPAVVFIQEGSAISSIATGTRRRGHCDQDDRLQRPGKLVVRTDRSLYAATMNSGVVSKVAANGTASRFADVESRSSSAFGRTDAGKDRLYMSTSSGKVLAYTAA